MEYECMYATAWGDFYLYADGEGITGLGMRRRDGEFTDRETPLHREAFRQLTEYLEGKRKDFDLPLKPAGTPFQQRVWQALREIPYGQTRSYGEIARAVGNPKASRAIGMANNRNPVMIFIPCHRVIGTDGRLVGYAGGLDVKERLLRLEESHR